HVKVSVDLIPAVFLCGALVTQIFVDTIKLMTGYQRPYFLSLCNVSISACTAPLEHSPSPSPHLACNFRGADELRYAWLTFPSLHAAFSSYSCIFASVCSPAYLNCSEQEGK
ncbi:acidPPc domain-containing protein, partial [Trichostrongylus colubriformis]